MTKQEFIQEAALRLISGRPDMKIEDIPHLAHYIASRIYTDKEEKPLRRPVSVLTDSPIQTLLDEIARMEARTKAEYEQDMEPGRYYQRVGYAANLRKLFKAEGISTVGDLLKRGRTGCLKIPRVGCKSIEHIDKALEKLYNVINW